MSSSVLHDNAGVALEVRGGDAAPRAQRVRAERHTGAEPETLRRRRPDMTPPPAGTDIMLLDAPRVTFVGNVISGEPAQRVRGLGADQAARFRESNIVLRAGRTSSRRRRPRRTPR